jgi:hypothetical protein
MKHRLIVLSLFSVFLLLQGMMLSSCKLFKPKNLTQEAQLGGSPKEGNRKKREKALEENRKRVFSSQTRETQKRMRANKRKSERINNNQPESTRKRTISKIFRRPRWWR